MTILDKKNGDTQVKKKSIILAAACAALLCIATPSLAGDKTVIYRNAKTLGMGNARVAGGFGYNGFVDNPALLARVRYVRLSILNLPITLNNNTTDIGKFIADNTDKFENFEELPQDEKNAFLKDVEKQEGKWSRINISPMVDIAATVLGNSVGLALYNTTEVGIKVDRGIYEPRVWGEGISYFVAAVGYARPLTMLYPGLTVGVNLKYIQRRRASLFQIKATDLGDNPQETMQPVLDEVTEEEHNTVAMDVGLLWDIPFIDSEVGAVFQSLGDGRGSSLDIGIAKRFFNDDLTILADYVDFLDNNRENILNKLHMGAEYSLQVIKLRAGINSGYPTAGLGINFKLIDIDVAYFFEELGNAPGMREDERYVLQLKMGW